MDRIANNINQTMMASVCIQRRYKPQLIFEYSISQHKFE